MIIHSRFYTILILFILTLTGTLQTLSLASVKKGARIIVDKAHPAHSDLTVADFQKFADTGFTTVVQVWEKNLNGQSIDFGEYATRAAQAKLAVMKWEHAVFNATNEQDRTVGRTGKTTRYTRPQSEWAWQELTNRLVAYAILSKTHHNIKGVLLDFEIYDKDKTDGFCESYDDQTFRNFYLDRGYSPPQPLPPAEQRQQYLIERQLLPLYVGYQIDQISYQARKLRQAIDAHNPNFQIGIYGWGVLSSPVITEMATKQAPALILDAMTYGRSIYSNAFAGGYDGNRPDSEGLNWTKEVVQKSILGAHRRYENVIFLAGHYPQSPGPENGTQYKFTVKQAFQSAAFGEGYWIWTDWITPKPWAEEGVHWAKARLNWHDAMLEYFAKAHTALDKQNLAWANQEPATVK